MVNLLNIFNTIADSNLAYYILVIILLIVVVSMIYLIYSQNKEMNETRKNREEQEELIVEEPKDMVTGIANEIKEEQEDEKFSRTTNTPIHDSVLEMIKKDEDIAASINSFVDEPVSEPVTEAPVIQVEDDREKVKTMVDIDLPKMKKQELIDATLTNLPKVSLLEETMTAIPPIMDYDGSADDLAHITKELASAPKERTIKLTPYEEEQEQTAIISYDELINSGDGIVYNNVVDDGNVEVKQVDLDKTTEIKLDEVEHEIHRENYAHEELFLNKLKSLQSKIN